MKKLRKTLQCVTELAVLPESYREDLKASLNCSEDSLRECGQFYACLLLSELEARGLNQIFVCCYLHQRYEAKQLREMHLFLMILLVFIGKRPSNYFIEIGHFDDLLESLMEEMLQCFDGFCLAATSLEVEEDDEY